MNRPGRGPGAYGGGQRAQDTQGTLLRLWGYLRQQQRTLIGVVCLVLLTTVLTVIGPYLMGVAIDTFIIKGDLADLARIALTMLGVYVATSLGIWLQETVMAGLAQRTIRDLRGGLFATLQTLSQRYFDQHPHGDLMSRLSNDVGTISNVLTSSATQLISSALTIVGVAVMMLAINIPLAVVTLLILPLMMILTKGITQRTGAGFRAQQTHLGELDGIIEETVAGQRVVKAYVREVEVIKSFDAANRKLQQAATEAEIYAGFMGPVMNMMGDIDLYMSQFKGNAVPDVLVEG
jgi:ATP-binding cassette subfamily B multidrug efflux pump